MVNDRIADFQEGVARRAAARAADPSWFYHRLWRTLRSRQALAAWLAAARPSPWGLVVLVMIGSFVRSIVEQFAQVRSLNVVGPCLAACPHGRYTCVRL